MIEKPLMFLSIIFSLLGCNSFAEKYDAAIAKIESGNVSKVVASNSPAEIGFPTITSTPSVRAFATRPDIQAKHYIIADYDSGKILAKSEEKEQVPIASTTKIMTAAVVLENFQLEDIVTVSETAANQIGADAFLRVGEKMTVEELLYCLLIKSGNDAAYALAEHANGGNGVSKFVSMMNDKAGQLGMLNTKYQDPAGLNDAGYSSAEDLLMITKHVMKNELFTEITGTKEYVARNVAGDISHPLSNSNRLVASYDYMGAIGVKTGYTPDAGHCLVSAVEREGHKLIGVVLNTYSDTADASAIESRKLQDWSWQNVEWK